MIRDSKGDRRLPQDIILDLPIKLNKPDAVLLDKQNTAIIYAFSLDEPRDSRGAGKFVIGVDVKKRRQIINPVKSGGILESTKLLKGSRYEVLYGEL